MVKEPADKDLEEPVSGIVEWATNLGWKPNVTPSDLKEKYLDFNEIYDLYGEPNPQHGWIRGFQLMARWQMMFDMLPVYAAPSHMPVYLIDRTGTPRMINEELDDKPNLWSMSNKALQGNPWLTISALWWFKASEICFLEKIRPGLRMRLQTHELTPRWFTINDLEKRWNIGPAHIEILIRDEGLPGFQLSPQGLTPVDDAFFSNRGGTYSPSRSLSEIMVRIRDLHRFEGTLFKLQKPTIKKPIIETQRQKKYRLVHITPKQLPARLVQDLGWCFVDQYFRRHGALPRQRDVVGILKHTRWGKFLSSAGRDQTLRDALKPVPLDRRPGR